MTVRASAIRSGRPTLSARASAMPRSAIRKMMEQAWQQADPIRLEVGEPDFSPPEHVIAAAADAATLGANGYAPNAGIPELREALAHKVVERNGFDARPDQIVVTNGATAGLYTTLRALTDAGDEILLPDPAWPNYRMIAHLLGLTVKPYRLRPDAGFLPDVEEIERLVTARTKVLLVVSPSNPLGVVLPAAGAQHLVALAERCGLWLMADEVYDELVFDGEHASMAAVAPSPQVVSLYSFSKVYAMCGWRIGYVVSNREVAELLADIQEPVTSSINTPAQHGALAAVTGPQDAVVRMRDAYRHRRDVTLAELARQGLPAFRPAGAFYTWIDTSRCAFDSTALAERLLAERSVCVAPGSAFGDAGHTAVRICLAANTEDLIEGSRRLGAFCAAYPRAGG